MHVMCLSGKCYLTSNILSHTTYKSHYLKVIVHVRSDIEEPLTSVLPPVYTAIF